MITPFARLAHLRRSVVAALVAAVVALVAVVGLLVGGRGPIFDQQRAATYFPILVYEIEAVSDGREASLLNLPLPNVGAPQVPIPVDINGDLIPDVTASVNLINAQGVFNNPPDAGELIAPNIEFLRLFTAPILNPLPFHDLRMNVKLTLTDLEGEAPDIVARFGYDTGHGGAIPPKYKAVLGGLTSGFNPLEAKIDTAGGLLLGLDPRLPDLGLGPNSSAYQGPLTTFVALDTGPALSADVDLRFRPMPDLVDVTFGSEDDGTQAFTYAHSERGEVDLDILGHIESEGTVADLDATIDRLPRAVALEILTGDDQGGIQYASERSSGRLADMSADIVIDDPDFNRPLRARVDAESLPETLGGTWNLAPGEPPQIDFAGSGQGVGAIEARVQNFEGSPTDFDPWVPDEQQHVSIQTGPDGVLVGDTLIQARLERLRAASMATNADGAIEGSMQVGNGERPLQVHGEIDLRSIDAPYIDATATIAPLPDTIDFVVTPTGDTESEPMRILYEPSETVDVDTEVLVGLPETVGPLSRGDPGTVYADVDLRNIPTRIEARVLNLATESRIEVDAVPRDGAAPLDVFANAVLGPVDADLHPLIDPLLAAPVHAEVSIQGLPQFARVRLLENEAQDLQRVDVRTCDLDYDTNICAPDTDHGIAEMDFAVRNFELDDRPADLPAPPQSGPLYLTVTARGLPDTNELVRYEATGRLTDFHQLTFLGTNNKDLTAARVDIGGGQDFRTWIDIEDVDVNGGDPDDGRVSLEGDIRITPLPSPLTFCFAQNGRPLTSTPIDEITAGCESDDPFGDGVAEQAPLILSYDAGGPFDVTADIELSGDLPFEQPELPVDFGTFDRIAAHLDLTNIPSSLTAYVQTPAESASAGTNDGTEAAATRVLTVAPGADDTRLALDAEITTPGVDCADPDPEGGAVCASVEIDQLPEFVSVLAETLVTPGAAEGGEDAVDSINAQFHACDFDFYAVAPSCRTPLTSIGVIDVSARAHAGSPTGVPTHLAPDDQPHITAQADIDDLANFEIEAGVRVEDLRHIVFGQDPDGVRASADLGDGVEPLTVHAYADLRDTTNLVPEELKAQAVADVILDPLPQQIDFEMTGPGQAQTDPIHVQLDTSAETVLTLDAEVREAGGGDACGEIGTACASLLVESVASHIAADIIRTFGPISGNERDSRTQLFIEQDSVDPVITASAAIGLPVLPDSVTQVIGDGPLFADLTLTGVPEHISVDMQNHEVLQSNGSELEVRDSSIEQFHFQTCRLDGDGACEGDSGDVIDLIEASVRTFDLRPTDFPTPPEDHDPLYIGLSGRGSDLEAVVSIPEISEVQFLNRDGLLGARAQVGGTTPTVDRDMQVDVDIEDLRIADQIGIGDLDVEDPRATVDATVDISPFPGELEFCMRDAGLTPLPSPTGLPFTATCEDTQPFGSTLDYSPLSVGFHANTDFDVDVDADVAIDGTNADTGDAIDRHRFTGVLALDDLPADLIFHFLQPRDVEVATPDGIVVEPHGPFQARIETPGATSGLDLTFAAAYLVGPDAVCEDPRPLISATCMSGTIRNLPTEVDFFYDPTLDLEDPSVDLNDPAQITNFVLQTDGPATTDIEDLRFSTTALQRLTNGALPEPLTGDVLLATADLTGIQHPFDLRGTLDTPDEEGQATTADFAVQGGNTLPGATIHIQNFLSPDPTIGAFVPDRPVGNNGLDTYEISAIQRGDAFVLDAELVEVREFGLRPVRAANRKPIGTTAIHLDVARDFNIRAFVDLAPEPGTRIIGDALIEDLPAAVDVCVRGPREGAAVGAVAVDGTWCDSGDVRDGDGAIEVAMDHNVPDREPDIDAFARYQFGGGSSVLAGRVDIENLPAVVRARYPGDSTGTDIEAATFSRVAGFLMPDGIDRIRFEAASFDLDQAATGIVGTLPYDEFVNGNAPFDNGPAPAPADGREYLHGAADLRTKDFHVRGQIGRTDGGPSSQFQRFLYGTRPCPEPRNDPADYPRMPTTDGTEYTCVQVDFDESSAEPNPLSLDVDLLLDSGEAVELHDAGISDIPAWIQLQIAKAEIYTDPENKRGWRRPCPAADSGDTGPCMAPLLRFDQPAETHLFGVADYGLPSDLGDLDGAVPARPAPDFQAVPDENGWDGAFEADQGIRATVLDYDGGTITNFDDDRIAARANFRLPIPQSLTVDQVQTFTPDTTQPQTGAPAAGDEASDYRFHAAVRDSNGDVVDKQGEVAAQIHLVDSNAQVLITDACENDVVTHDIIDYTNIASILASAGDILFPDHCDRHLNGFSLPGEMGITLYMRNHIQSLSDTRLRSSTLLQVDGNVSTPLSIGARIVGNGNEVTDGITLDDVEANIRNVPAASSPTHAYDPGFRLRAEMISDGDKPSESNEDTGESTSEQSGEGGADVPWVEFNTTVNVGIQRAIAGFDFNPTGTPARRLDAVIYNDGAKLGADIAGFSSIAGTTPNAEISAGFSAFVDPLNFFGRLVTNLGTNLDTVCHDLITEELGGPEWLGEALGWICGKVGDALDAVLKLFPIDVDLRSTLGAQFTVDRLSQFTLRSDVLRANMSGTGSGEAELGPVNLYLEHLFAGMHWPGITLDIPDWIDWCCPPFFNVPDEVTIGEIRLLGYGFDPISPLATLEPPVLLDFRDCDALGGFASIVPFAGGGFDNAVTLDPGVTDSDVEDFIIWPGTDPRMSIDGIIWDVLFGGPVGTAVVDGIVDLLAGPILCNAIFDVDAGSFQGINLASADPNTYNPGNAGTVAFEGHPVPGQPGQAATLPEEQPVPVDPIVFPPPPVSPGPPAPPPPPGSPPPLYVGPTDTIAVNTAMCGVHTYDVLTVSAEVTVATTAGANCPAGSEGALELRANTLLVTAAGSINADGVSADVAHFDDFEAVPTYPDYRATGNSGGTNAGVGFEGSYVDSAPRPYSGATSDLEGYPGGPGSEVAADFQNPDVDADGDPGNGTHGPIPSAGAPGDGGGLIVLRADNALTVNGTLTADGDDGATNTTATIDNDPDDNGVAGWQSFPCDHDDDVDTDPINVLNARRDGAPGGVRPCVTVDIGGPYEHTGFAGSGGGAGGSIVLEARYQVDIDNATISAAGGSGGSGVLGNGGAGGGGVIKVIAPIPVGADSATLDAATVAGLNGSAALAAGVAPTANPFGDADGDPGTIEVELETDGAHVVLQPPFARLQPNGPFWHAGGAGAPSSTFDGYYVGGGGPTDVTLHVCAVRLPASSGPDNAALIGQQMNALLPTDSVGSLPSVGNPCGSRAGSDIVSVTTSPNPETFTGAITTPQAVGLDIDSSGYYGLYTTAIRSGHVEPLAGVEWVIGVDADRPTATLTAPAAGEAFDTGQAILEFTETDQADLSGYDFTECRTTGDPEWRVCESGQPFPLLSPDGAKTLEVRGYDEAGNRSLVSAVSVFLDTDAPNATLTFNGGVVNAGWYRVAPALHISGYDGEAPAGDPPYVYQFDNGFEQPCATDATAPYTCDVSAAEVGTLTAGEHTVSYSGVSSSGQRFDNNVGDATYPSPMPSESLLYDPDAPIIELATVPSAPNRTFSGQGWFDTRPYVVGSAVDQFGASGVDDVEYSLSGLAGPWIAFDPADPPRAGNGTTTACVRATDVAGNLSTDCETLRVDDSAPTLTLTPDGTADGANGWYVSAPTFTVGGYDDGVGVGIDSDRFRWRVDNGFSVDCDPACPIAPANLPTGRHLVHASAADRFENRSGELTEEVLVDLEPPVVVPVLGPSEPDGMNGWYHRAVWLTLFAEDPGLRGANGVNRQGSGVDSIEYSLTGAGGPFIEWTEPTLVGAGDHTLCWRATDVAGHVSDPGCQPFLIDTDDPTTTLDSLPPGPSGWYGGPVEVDVVSADAAPGSGVDQTFDADLSDLCDDLTPAQNATTPSGTCVSVDGGPYVPFSGPFTLGEGVHDVRAFSVDVSGRRGPVVQNIYRVDRSPPVVVLRTLPPDSARNGWYRGPFESEPIRVVLRANDGRDGSGVESLEYRLNGGAWEDYVEPFNLVEGEYTIQTRAADLVGMRSDSTDVRADTTSPFAHATQSNRLIWSRLLGPKTLKLNFRLADNLSGIVDASVIIYDATGNPVRTIDAGDIAVVPGADPVNRSVTWDGRQGTATGLVPLGVYHYRVVVVDEAGNTAFSGESKPITIRLL